MLRWVVLLILLWLAFELLMRSLRRLSGSLGAHRATANGGAPPAAATGPRELVRCATCGVHFPTGERGGRDPRYCSEECRRQAGGR